MMMIGCCSITEKRVFDFRKDSRRQSTYKFIWNRTLTGRLLVNFAKKNSERKLSWANTRKRMSMNGMTSSTFFFERFRKFRQNFRPFLCSECGLRFVRNDYLVIHMRRHKGEKPYKCKLLSLNFRRNWFFSGHSGKYCNKGFPRATDLTVHERYHTGEKTHLCTICGKGFQRAYNLLVHTRVHTGNCEHFFEILSIYEHNKKFSGERPYKCPHCIKSFAQGNDLKAHG